MEGQESKGMSIAAMVLGIVSVVFCCIAYISIPCAILALILNLHKIMIWVLIV